MYHPLDTPPPPSQLYGTPQGSRSSRHRPWPPDDYEPLPSTVASSSNLNPSRETFNKLQRNMLRRPPREDEDRSLRVLEQRQPDFVDEYPPLPEDQFPVMAKKSPEKPRASRWRRKEPSEMSVEALDLADYAKTLRSRQAEDPYPPFPSSSQSPERKGGKKSSAHPPSSFHKAKGVNPRPFSTTSSQQSHSSLPLFQDPGPSGFNPGDTFEPEYGFARPKSNSLSHERRREASDVSVEALDLADYSRTLRSKPPDDPYSSFPSFTYHNPQPVVSYPPSSFPQFTRGGTRSSANTSTTQPQSVRSVPTHVGSSRRPFSVPATPYQSTPNLANREDPEEIDVTQFPSWSRDWYNSNDTRGRRPPQNDLQSIEAYELEAGFAPPKAFIQGGSNSRNSLPHSNSKTGVPLSPFDPAYIHPESYPRGRGDGYDDNESYPTYSAPSYNNHDYLMPYDSTRGGGIVPWSHDPPEYRNLPLDPQVKEERIRMLEQEFRSDKKKGKGKAVDPDAKEKPDDGLMRDENGKLIIGTPDGKGGLATQAPILRATFRFLQFALSVAVGGPVVWAAVALKPDPPPPPAGKPPFFILAVLAPITFLVLCYFFLIRPCTHRRRPSDYTLPGAQGMMVLPVQNPANGKKWKPGKGPKPPKGKKGAGPPGDVQVNLIVDPNAFGMPEELSSSDDETDELDADAGGFPAGFFGRHPPNTSSPFDADSLRRQQAKEKAKEKAKRKRNRRRTLLASMKLEGEWRVARKWLRVVSMADAGMFVLWGVAFGFVIAGSRCPTGGEDKGFGGWCTAYNASTAAACILCVTFAVSLFFDVKDLYASKASPRTRV